MSGSRFGWIRFPSWISEGRFLWWAGTVTWTGSFLMINRNSYLNRKVPHDEQEQLPEQEGSSWWTGTVTWTGRFRMMNRNCSQGRLWFCCLYFFARRWGGLKYILFIQVSLIKMALNWKCKWWINIRKVKNGCFHNFPKCIV